MSARTLAVNPDRALPLAFLSIPKVVYGASGSGKTTFGRRLFEQATVAGVCCGAVDLKGDWYGLKSTADGRHEGIPVVVFGGDHQDVPITPDGGAQLADVVVDLRQPFVVDLERFSKSAQLRFLPAFFERLFERNRDPLVLFCDEADRYAPQFTKNKDAYACRDTMEDIAKRGRKHGLFPVFITQRSASLSKDVSELCEIVVVFRTPGPKSQAAVEDWFATNATVEQRDAAMAALAGLPNGTAVFCSANPDVRLFDTMPVLPPDTFDSSATPRLGRRRVEPRRLAKPDLAAIESRMTAMIERVRADDPARLRARVAELERQLASTSKVVPAKVIVQQASIRQGKPRPALSARDRAALRRAAADLDRVGKSMARAIGHAAPLLEVLGKIASKASSAATSNAPTALPTTLARSTDVQPTSTVQFHDYAGSTRQVAAPPDGRLPIGERAILTAAAQHPDGATRAQLTVLTGYKRSSRDAYVARLVNRGFVAVRDDVVRVTAPGTAALGHGFQPLPTGDALRRHWLERLPVGERRILESVLLAYPNAVDRDALTASTGYKRSSRDAYLGRLAARRLVVPVGRGQVCASAELFSTTTV